MGVDLGGDRSTTVLQNGEIIRSELGGHDTATLVSLKPRERLIGESAVAMVTSNPKGTISAAHTMVGTPYSVWSKRASTQHVAFSHSEADGELGGTAVTVERQGGPQTFNGTELLAMLLCKLRACAAERMGASGEGDADAKTAAVSCNGCFSSPDCATPVARRAILDAARIAGFGEPKVFPASECLCAVYAQKHPVTKGSLAETVLMVDMGHLQTTVIVASFGGEDGDGGDGDQESSAPPTTEAMTSTKGSAANRCPYKVLAVRSDQELGALSFDERMFQHFGAEVQSRYKQDVQPGTKQGLRLLSGCRRLRELLSTTPTAEVTVENLVDGTDVPLSMTRAELASFCEEEVNKLKNMVRGCLEAADAAESGSISGVQAAGGGCRMPLVQAAIRAETGLPMGSKLDSSSLAYGAALLAKDGATIAAATEADGAVGLSVEDISQAIQSELNRQQADTEMQAIALERNEMESLLFDMRSAPNKKHGELLDKDDLNAILDGLEEWLYSEEADDVDLPALKAKRAKIDANLKGGVAQAYFGAMEEDKRKVEAELDAEAKAFEEEQRNNPEEEDDHDTRKLPKPDRMRLVVKNKEEGTELFKGQNYRAAGARYSKALTHAAKMFDLNADEKEEVTAVQLSLYLNLAQCYLKLQNWDQVANNCALALKIDPNSSKALYRRAYASVCKKDHDAAKADLILAQKSAPGDKAVATLLKKVDTILRKQQEKEKQMWGKAFS